MKNKDTNGRAHNAAIFREHGWELINGIPGPKSSVGNNLEFWAKGAGGLAIVQVWDDGSITNYFRGGGETWLELDDELDLYDNNGVRR